MTNQTDYEAFEKEYATVKGWDIKSMIAKRSCRFPRSYMSDEIEQAWLWFNSGLRAAKAHYETRKVSGDVVEILACLEHEQWMQWAKTIVTSEAISAERKTRWFDCFKPYHELTEEQKEHDRVWARKVIAALQPPAGQEEK